jgi:hypothetical protein
VSADNPRGKLCFSRSKDAKVNSVDIEQATRCNRGITLQYEFEMIRELQNAKIKWGHSEEVRQLPD